MEIETWTRLTSKIDINNCNRINLEKLILLGGYNQLVKGYQITKKMFMISFSGGVPTQIKF